MVNFDVWESRRKKEGGMQLKKRRIVIFNFQHQVSVAVS